jgi:phage terminase small subunit
MASGGARAGAGRKPKPAAQKILEGNPGRREIRLLAFEETPDIPENPPEYFSDTAKKIHKDLIAWLKSIGCTKGILPYNVEEYAFCKARWIECEKTNSTRGLILKDPASGKPLISPFVVLAQGYLRDTNEVWAKIYAVIRESKLQKWDENSPNDDVFAKLMGGKKQ